MLRQPTSFGDDVRGCWPPTRADLARIDRKRKKKGSNDDWTHPRDPDAKITKLLSGEEMTSRDSMPDAISRARR